MSVLTVLAAIPCVGSLKRADTIIKELAAQGLAIVIYKRVTEPFVLPASASEPRPGQPLDLQKEIDP